MSRPRPWHNVDATSSAVWWPTRNLGSGSAPLAWLLLNVRVEWSSWVTPACVTADPRIWRLLCPPGEGVPRQTAPHGGSPKAQAGPLNRFSLVDSLEGLIGNAVLSPEKRTCSEALQMTPGHPADIPGPQPLSGS